MKKMHFPRPYKRRKKTGLIVSLVACVLLVYIAGMQPSFVTKMMLTVTDPFHTVRENILANTDSFWGGFRSRQALYEENKKLTEALTRATIKADLYDALRRQYARKETTATSTSGMLEVAVLETPPFSPYDTFILDAGSSQGVSVGDRVSYDSTVALGVIDTVSKNTSRVRLFSSPENEQEVRVGTNDFLVVARGMGGGIFEVTIPKNVESARGDSVFLSTGELIGVIQKVVESDVEAFRTAFVAVPKNMFEVRTVVVERQEALE